MNTMMLDFCTGALSIDSDKVVVASYDRFIQSDFYANNVQLQKWGRFFFNLPAVNWLGGTFYLEIRPSVNNIMPCVYMVNRDGAFFQSIDKWEKHADINTLKNEELRLIKWIREHIKGGSEYTIKTPPYGVEWKFDWGSITVQSHEQTFDCGIYITWN